MTRYSESRLLLHSAYVDTKSFSEARAGIAWPIKSTCMASQFIADVRFIVGTPKALISGVKLRYFLKSGELTDFTSPCL